jgi:ferritin
MLSKNIEKLLNEQVQLEFESSQFYLAMASWAETKGLNGVSGFLYGQADEERVHMLKLFHFVNERGGHAAVGGSKPPKAKFKNVKEVFDDLLKHELTVTREINKLVDACLKEKDYTTHNFLQWYVSEQIEEEKQAMTILDKLELLGEDRGGLYLFDRDLASMATAPAADAADAGK